MSEREQYQVFAAFGPNCWRGVLPPFRYNDFQSACRAAEDRVSEMWGEYVVSTHRDGPVLYTTKKPFAEVARHNAIVHEILSAGGTLEDVVVALDRCYRDALRECGRMRMLCPTRMKLPDGKIVVWRCPEDLIPLTDLSQVMEPECDEQEP